MVNALFAYGLKSCGSETCKAWQRKNPSFNYSPKYYCSVSRLPALRSIPCSARRLPAPRPAVGDDGHRLVPLGKASFLLQYKTIPLLQNLPCSFLQSSLSKALSVTPRFASLPLRILKTVYYLPGHYVYHLTGLYMAIRPIYGTIAIVPYRWLWRNGDATPNCYIVFYGAKIFPSRHLTGEREKAGHIVFAVKLREE